MVFKMCFCKYKALFFLFLVACRYTEKANSVQQEETVVNIQFVMLDCSPLKSSLVQHCNEWQTKFTQLLSHMASTRLQELHASLQDNANRCKFKGTFVHEALSLMCILYCDVLQCVSWDSKEI